MSLTNNYFDVFNLPVSFDVNKELLSQRYRDLQRAVHPDKYATSSERERRLAMQKATQINEAFQTLKNPIARGQYLLQLHGTQLNDQDPHLDDQFLIEQIELREELSELKSSGELNKFLSRIERRMHTLTVTLSQHFAQQNFQAAREYLRQFQFFKRLYDEALTLEEELT